MIPLLFRKKFQVHKKVSFELKPIAVSLSLLIREARLRLKLMRVYLFISIFIKCLKKTSKRVGRIFECVPSWNWDKKLTYMISLALGLSLKNILKMSTSSHPDVFLRIGDLKIWSKVTGEHPCRSVISIKLQSIHSEQQWDMIRT